MAEGVMALYGGIEGGGSKFVCAVASSVDGGLRGGPPQIKATTSVVTTTPDETVSRVIAFFQKAEQESGPIQAIGMGMFGPIDLRAESPTYGRLLRTPKPGWSGADVLGPVRQAFAIPVALDTDVNAAALAEWRWGAALGCDPALYLTVGTGIGGGAVVGARPVHGLLHPEMGHLHVRRHPADPAFPGICPFHGDCLEGMASGPALGERWGAAPSDIPADHRAWHIEAYYLAQALTAYIYTLSPERIVLGGGVMRQAGLLEKVRQDVRLMLGGYLESESVGEEIDRYIVPPALGEQAGVLGALALAERAAAG